MIRQFLCFVVFQYNTTNLNWGITYHKQNWFLSVLETYIKNIKNNYKHGLQLILNLILMWQSILKVHLYGWTLSSANPFNSKYIKWEMSQSFMLTFERLSVRAFTEGEAFCMLSSLKTLNIRILVIKLAGWVVWQDN